MKPWVCVVKKQVWVAGESQRCRHGATPGCGEMEYKPVEVLVIAKENGEWPEWALTELRQECSWYGASAMLDALAKAEAP